MRIQNNISAMNTYRQLAGNQGKMKKALEVLSSGYQVNRAADNAAGLAISEKMRMQITGTDVAIKNCKDVSSLLTTAEGGLVEMHDMLNRALELAEQSANGTFDDEIDRAQLQKELDSLRSDIDRIAESTNFNDIDVLHITHAETAQITGRSVAKTVSAVTGERSVSRATMLSARQANVEAAAKPMALALENSAPMMRVASVRAAAPEVRSGGITCGDFTISGDGLVENTDYSFSGGVLTIRSDKMITIKNNNANVATTNRIEVASGVNANITLDGVNIDVSGQANTAAFKIADDSTGSVTVTLKGNNNLKSGENCAGLQKNGTTGRLTITGDRYSALTVQGGKNGAGIGGGYGKDSSNITIKDGLITAIGGEGKTAIQGSNATLSESAKKAIIFASDIMNLSSNTTLANGDVLEVFKGSYLSLECDVTLTGGTIKNSGQIRIYSNGKIINNGDISSIVNNGYIGVNNGAVIGEVQNETGCFYSYVTLPENQYIDENGSLRVHDGELTELTAEMLTTNSNTISAGWYVVKGDTAINDRITINGDVHLILANGCDMKALEGIHVDNGGSFTVYGQSDDGIVGKLTATGKGSDSGIGGGDNASITIISGEVTASSEQGTAIGKRTDNVIINGGTVTATGGQDSAAIGGNFSTGANGNALIMATGGNGAAGIDDADNTSDWNCIIIQGNEGYAYGNVTTKGDVTINEGATLTVLENSTLTTGGFYLTNNGTINVSVNSTLITDSISSQNYGTISNHGKIISKRDFYHHNGIIENYSDIENKGDLSIDQDSKIILHGGKIDNTEGNRFINGGVVSGTGEITGTPPANSGIILLNKEFTSATSYIDASGQTHTCNEVVKLTEDMTGLTEGWYVVTGDITISERFKTNGDVHLILADGAHLNAEKGIDVNNNASLTIYAQSDNESTMGQLTAVGGEMGSVGIGGDGHSMMGMGNITINGGKITATGGEDSIGIGGRGGPEDSGSITINGGVVEATGNEWGSGIGGDGIEISITGGTVKATGDKGAGIGGRDTEISITGGTVTATSDTGAGIGGSNDGSDWFNSNVGKITIDGGTVTATSNTGAGIGGSAQYCTAGEIIINGGTVTATSTDGAGIGGTNGTNCTSGAITINGGTVTATSTNYDGIGGKDGTFAATGNAVVIANGGTGANAITDADDTSAWNGIIIQGNVGQVYGDVTTTGDVTIPSGNNTTIPADVTLTIGNDATLTNEGTLSNLGNVVIDGTLNNKGTINNDATGTLTNNGELNIETGGKVTNNGTLKNEGNLNNAGELENNGTCNSTNGIITGAGTISGSQPVTPGGNVVCGDFTVSGGTLGTDYNFENGVLTVLTDTALTIKNTTPGTATTDRIEIAKDVNANVTLDGVNIDVSGVWGGVALKIEDNSTGNVTITLAGDNMLKSASACAGLQKNGTSGHLEIKGSGELKAYGGSSGAGIGGGSDKASGNITISSGTVTATGGSRGAYESGAGIGGGKGQEGSNITISGGTVTAKGGVNSSGIGGGYGSTGSTGNQITGGLVTVRGDGQSIQGSNITLPLGNQEVVIIGAGHQLDIATDTIYSSNQSIKVLSGGTLNVADGVTLTDECAIDNQGTINIAGTLKLNYDASLNNKSGGKVNMNNGMIDNSSTGSISNNGDITGTGEIIGYVSGTQPTSGITLTPSSTLSDFTVTGGTEGVDYVFDSEFDTLLIKTDTALTIKNKDTTTATTNSIRIEGNVNANVTLAGVNIDSSSAAFDVWSGDNGQVTVTLAAGSKNVLKSGYGAGLNKVGSGNLEIKGTGELTAIGGVGCAGIGGGGMDRDSGNITISDGTINAIGGEGGAGIGGGRDGSGSNITISGGTVTAQGGADAAGIGGGKKDWESSTASGSNNQITGGVVTAIGNGAKNAVEGGNVTSAESASKATIVGTGAQLDITANTTIGDGEVVEVMTGGTLNVANGVTLNVADGAAVNNAGTINNNGTIHNQGTISGSGAINGNAPIGDVTPGGDVTCGAFTVTGGTLNTDYKFADGVLTILKDTAITIKNTDPGVATTDRIEIDGGVNANVTLAGVNIDVCAEWSSAALKIADNSTGNVTITLASGTTNILKSGEMNAGLEKNGDAEGVGELVIQGSGTLEASSIKSGAGIGGRHFGTSSNITITGGTVIATSGLDGAGIGGGASGNGNNITITGGTVTAESKFGGAGIGSGSRGTCDNINISGGDVTAKSTNDGAGIGCGGAGNCGAITIDGGNVTVTGGDGGGVYGGGAGIGGTNANVTINDGNVIATGGKNGGSGIGGEGSTVTVEGGDVTAIGGENGGTGIGGTDGTVTVEGGTVTSNGGENGGTGILGGDNNVTVTGGVVSATGGSGQSAIQGSDIDSTDGKNKTTIIGAGGQLDITTDTTIGNGEVVEVLDGGTLNVKDGTTLTIEDGGTLNNAGTVNVDGTLDIKGTFNNKGETTISGTVTNTSSVTNDGKLTVNDGGKVNNETGGTVTNTTTGKLDVETGGVMDNKGTLDNEGDTTVSGTVTNTGSVTNEKNLTVENGGKVNNETGGTVTNTTTGKLDVDTGGALDNKGTLDNEGDTTVSGTVTNTGNVNNEKNLTVESGGKVNNETGGTITNTNTGNLDVDTGGSLGNKGTLDNKGETTVSGTVTNTGNTTNEGNLTVESGGKVNNETSGTITNTGTGNLDVDTGGSLDNEGTLDNKGNTTVSGEITNTGSTTNEGNLTVESGGKVNNETGGTVTNTETGKLDVGTGGALDNKGTMENKGNTTVSGEVSNTGTLTNAAGGNIKLENGTINTPESGGGSFNNEGTVAGSGTLSGTQPSGGGGTSVTPPTKPDPPTPPVDPDKPDVPDKPNPPTPPIDPDKPAFSGVIRFQIGIEFSEALDFQIEDMCCASLGIDGVSIDTQDAAAKAIERIKKAVNTVSDYRGYIGATQNRIEHTINNLSVMQENITNAESLIRDTDVASEMMKYTKSNILIQSAQAMLAQANQVPEAVLTLLS